MPKGAQKKKKKKKKKLRMPILHTKHGHLHKELNLFSLYKLKYRMGYSSV